MSDLPEQARQALALLEAARNAPEGTETGGLRNAHEWMEDIVRALAAQTGEGSHRTGHDPGGQPNFGPIRLMLSGHDAIAEAMDCTYSTLYEFPDGIAILAHFEHGRTDVFSARRRRAGVVRCPAYRALPPVPRAERPIHGCRRIPDHSPNMGGPRQ